MWKWLKPISSRWKRISLGVIIGIFVIGIPLGIEAYKEAHKFEGIPTASSSVSTTKQPPSLSPRPNNTNVVQPNNPDGQKSVSTAKNVIPGICTKIPTPYPTQYENEYGLPVGQTKVFIHGANGYTMSCTNNSDGTNDTHLYEPVTPITQVVWVGAAQPANPSPPPTSGQISYQQAESNCSALGTSNSSAWEQCLHAYGY